jgi:aspartokinase-like uncharacterized kinase
VSDPLSSRVVKLGGSLLELPDLVGRLRGWLERQPPAADLVIAGGGQFVDELRALDRLHHLGEEACHGLAIRAMSLTARLLQALVPEWPLITRLDELSGGCVTPAILDPGDFLEAEERSTAGPPLPHSWEVTSDSIAARVACRAGAAELVLLKSSLPPEHSDTDLAATVGYVDACFPQASRGLRVRCVDLRDPACPQRWLAPA